MTDDEIITALECCNNGLLKHPCLICPLKMDDDCEYILLKRALDIINRQKAEIERLKAEIEEANVAEREAENQALNENKEHTKIFLQAIEHAKSEAIKEFAERLKYRADKTRIKNIETEKIVFYMDEFKLDNLVKEMTEGQDDGK